MKCGRIWVWGCPTLYFACGLLIVSSLSGQTLRPPPHITAIAPPRAAVGDTVTIAGTAFGDYLGGTSSVQVGRCPSQPSAPGPGLIAIAPQDITSWSDTQIKFVLPPRSLGIVSITRADGQMSNVWEFEVIAPCTASQSVLASLNPSNIPAGSGDTPVILSGSDFTADTSAKSDGTSLVTTYVNSTSLRAVLPASLLREPRTLQITVLNAGASSPALPFVVMPWPPAVAAVVNAASLLGGPVAPGEIVSVFGSNLGPVAPAGVRLDSNGRVTSQLAATRVLFDKTAAPLTYASDKQINAIVPFSLAGNSRTLLTVECFGLRSEVVVLDVVQAAPGVFTLDGSGRGRGAILNQDGTQNSAASPASPDSIVVLYATGAGQTNPPAVDGALMSGELPQPTQHVSVQIGDLPAEVLYAGAAPGLVAGILQVNARVPRDMAGGGPKPLLLFIGAATTQPNVMVEVSPR